MKIKEITNRLRNDIYGILECEHCGATRKFTGYDDAYYHNTVLPNLYCEQCGLNGKGEKKVSKYRKKPVVIDAVQWTGDNHSQLRKIIELSSCNVSKIRAEGNEVFIETLEGTMKASVGDYIIKGVKGELYPCKPDIFKETYESADTTDKGSHIRNAINILMQGKTFYDGYFDNIENLSRADKALRELLIAVGELF